MLYEDNMENSNYMKEDSLATELLKQIKLDKKRWFIIAMVELFIIFALIGIFFWYISLPIDADSVEQSVDGTGVNQVAGGNIYGGNSESNPYTQSG